VRVAPSTLLPGGRREHSLNAKVAKVAKEREGLSKPHVSHALARIVSGKGENSINAEGAEELREDAEEKQQQKIEGGSA
jgi:hypothetical protein